MARALVGRSALVRGLAGCGGQIGKGLGGQRPDILFVPTDDQAPEDLAAMGMGKVKALLSEPGVTFENAFATTPICCPSRVSFMRGQYVYNHGVLTNNRPDEVWAGDGVRRGFWPSSSLTSMPTNNNYRYNPGL
jgi:N-acetylglucosamine-6-sulfatase